MVEHSDPTYVITVKCGRCWTDRVCSVVKIGISSCWIKKFECVITLEIFGFEKRVL